MVAIVETAYPRINQELSPEQLKLHYTPTRSERSFALKHCKQKTVSLLGFLVQLKVFQHLGRFVNFSEIPVEIAKHIKKAIRSPITIENLKKYYASGRKDRHTRIIRDHQKVNKYDRHQTEGLVIEWANDVAETKEDLADIINVLIEKLIKERYELPSFRDLKRIATTARSKVNTACYRKLASYLDTDAKALIDSILSPTSGMDGFGWHTLRSEPKQPTPRNIRAFLTFLKWLKELQAHLPSKLELPPVKHQQFINEAKSLDFAEVTALKSSKRYAMVIVLIRHQYGSTLDNVVDIYTKIIKKMHRTAAKQLDKYLLDHAKRTDLLVEILSDTVKAYIDNGDTLESAVAIGSVLGQSSASILTMCEEHLAYSGKNYLPFIRSGYKKQRSQLFRCLDIMELKSGSEDMSLIRAIEFITKFRNSNLAEIPIIKESTDGNAQNKNIINIRWISDRWWKLVTGKSTKTARVTHVNKLYFELCVFDRVADELGNGDLYVPFSDEFEDTRDQVITVEQYEEQVQGYVEEVGLILGHDEFTDDLKQSLVDQCHLADSQFLDNEHLRFEKGKLVIGKPKTLKPPAYFDSLDTELRRRLKKKNIIDIIIDVDSWLNLHNSFGPLSGFESKIDNPLKRFVLTLFCYGCNVGATETARSVKGMSRKQIAWLNLKRVTQERQDRCINKVTNEYNKYELPKLWGSGNTVSADGTLWNLYEDNLLSEYHIRYGSYGGIGYYHVSDTYIALFSRFIPCGVYEAIYILDGIINNESDFEPDTLHGDTQAQNTIVFGLAHLLGIKLMPRIRNIKDLIFYKPDRTMDLEHLNSIFSESIKWDLIRTHYADMLRVAMSVRNGTITASAILRRLGTKNRKNKLYFAFRELGRVVRTKFLLEYISNTQLRQQIQAATCKSEEFNQFAQWIFFANGGLIAENLKAEQTKIIKYNHLLANIVTLYNVNEMTQVFNQMKAEGFDIKEEDMSWFSPYRTEHIGRLGSYQLDLNRKMQTVERSLNIK